MTLGTTVSNSSVQFRCHYDHRQWILNQTQKTLARPREIALIGPIDTHGVFGREVVKSIRKFRTEQYEARSPWMNLPAVLELEERLQLDERSQHFLAVRGNEIQSALRLTTAPFEFPELNPALGSDASKLFRNFFEVSRFLTRKNSCVGTARALLYKAAHWMLSETDKEGVFGICRPVGKKYFQRFGLRPFDERSFEVPQRPTASYTLMWSNLASMYTHLEAAIIKELKIA